MRISPIPTLLLLPFLATSLPASQQPSAPREARTSDPIPEIRLAPAVRPPAMEVLPLGAVRPEGWLRLQLEKQRDGLTGHAEELYRDIGQSDWLTGKKRGGEFAWERGPYYARGLVALALILDDPALKTKARRWVDAALASQRPDGDFGPKSANWWANMLALHYLRDYQEATGDERIIPFLLRYADYHLRNLDRKSLRQDSPWAMCRAGDEIEVLLWLHAKTQNHIPLTLAAKLLEQAADWTRYYHFGGDGGWNLGYREHIVNFMQGLKLPALQARLLPDSHPLRPLALDAYRAAFGPTSWAMAMHGRPDRMLNGMEPLCGRSPSSGTELCAIAERILSCREVIAATAEVLAADDLERVAYNSLPATLGDDGKGARYYCVLNQPRCAWGQRHCCVHNPVASSFVPCADPGFGCCRSNFHMAWPKFVQSMWMRSGNGLAAIAYGPSTVSAQGLTLKIGGNYPFGDTVTIEILASDGARRPLDLRIPGWTKRATIRLNCKCLSNLEAGTFFRLERVWSAGERLELCFEPETERIGGLNGSISLRRGPLLYCLPVEAEVKTTAYTNPKDPSYCFINAEDLKQGRDRFPAKEYLPKVAWNRVLLCQPDEAIPFYPAPLKIDTDPFRHGAAPCRLEVQTGATSLGGWGTWVNDAGAIPHDPPPSPVPDTLVTDIKPAFLVPLGSTQVRLALLPWAPAPATKTAGRPNPTNQIEQAK